MTLGCVPSLTACIIAKNEATNLKDLVPTLQWANETLVVVDEASTDDSANLAASLGARVEIRPFSSFARFRNDALEIAVGTWVLFIDADERVVTPLAREIRDAVAGAEARLADGDQGAPVGFWLPRRNIIFGRPVRGGGWSPDFQLRLMRRERARYDENRPVHEVVLLDGAEGHLQQRLVHHNYRSVAEFFAKQRRYTRMEAEAARAVGHHPRRRALVSAPAREFKRRYLDLRGWTDGPLGLFLSATMAYFAYERVRLTRQSPAPRSEEDGRVRPTT